MIYLPTHPYEANYVFADLSKEVPQTSSVLTRMKHTLMIYLPTHHHNYNYVFADFSK